MDSVTLKLVDAQILSANANLISEDIPNIDRASVQFNLTGANLIGKLVVTGCNDGINYDSMEVDTDVDTTSGLKTKTFNLGQYGVRFVKVDWVHTSGSGQVDAFWFAKTMS